MSVTIDHDGTHHQVTKTNNRTTTGRFSTGLISRSNVQMYVLFALICHIITHNPYVLRRIVHAIIYLIPVLYNKYCNSSIRAFPSFSIYLLLVIIQLLFFYFYFFQLIFFVFQFSIHSWIATFATVEKDRPQQPEITGEYQLRPSFTRKTQATTTGNLPRPNAGECIGWVTVASTIFIQKVSYWT